MKVAVPGNPSDARPPVATGTVPIPGAATRPAVRRRPSIRPLIWQDPWGTLEPHDPYIRRFWTAVIGPVAVTELLRLVTAARKQSTVSLPRRLPQLAAENLVRLDANAVWVRPLIPTLGPRQLRSLSPALRSEHRRLRE